MSDWSSFENDKSLIDDWRAFSSQPIEIDEGLYGTLKGITGAAGLPKLLSTTTIENYKIAYEDWLANVVTIHKGDPRLKASKEQYMENFDKIVYAIRQNPSEASKYILQIAGGDAVGDPERSARAHLLKVIETDKEYVSPLDYSGQGATIDQLMDSKTTREYAKKYVILLKMSKTPLEEKEAALKNFVKFMNVAKKNPEAAAALVDEYISNLGDPEGRPRTKLKQLLGAPAGAGAESDAEKDADGDGIPDVSDDMVDADGDGVPDVSDDLVDTDGDGKPDETAEFKLQPLSKALKRAKIPRHAIIPILRNIKKQLKTNQIPVKMAEELVRELTLLIEGKGSGGKKRKKKKAQTRHKARSKPRPSVKPRGGTKLGTGMGALKNVDTSQLSSGPKAKPKKRLPKSLRGTGVTQADYNAMSTKEKIAALKRARKDKGLSTEPAGRTKAKKMPASVAATGMTQDEYDRLSRKEKIQKMRQSRGLQKGESPSKAKSSADRSEPEVGKIKVSALNLALQGLDPPVSRQDRSSAISVVKKHLQPYLKKYKLRLSEEQLEHLSYRTVDELQKLGILL